VKRHLGEKDWRLRHGVKARALWALCKPRGCVGQSRWYRPHCWCLAF
jgi:hypothetical protein